jgi:long-chain acyl-CoA synthetase
MIVAAELRIIDHLRNRSMTDPNKTFVADQYRSVTYGSFHLQMLEKAAGLQQLGVSCQDRVLLVLEHGIDHLLSYFACMHIGAIPVHLNIHKPKTAILQAAQITRARFCIADGHPEELSGLPLTLFAFKEIRFTGKEAVPIHTDIAYMMFTSGTTGIPKAVMTSHDNTIATAMSILDFANQTQTDRELISLPLSFTFGLGHMHALIIVGGEAFLTNRRYDTGYLVEAIQERKATGFLASPAMLKDIVKNYREQLICCGHYLRTLVVNCTPMEASLTEELLKLLPQTQLYMYYGSTEASRCAYIHYNENRHRLDFTGKACLNVALKIDRPDASGAGEICMKGPNVMPGYWDNPEATAQTIDPEGWIHSGDLGIMDEDGYVKVIGRINDQISVDGMKCQPAEVENVIRELPFVEQATACAIPDPDKFQVVGVAIVPKEKAPADFRERVREHCRTRLEPYKQPVVIEIVERIPANELGKVNRKELTQLLISLLQEA